MILGHWQDNAWSLAWVDTSWAVGIAPAAVGGAVPERRKRRYLIDTENGPLLIDEDRRIINEIIAQAEPQVVRLSRSQMRTAEKLGDDFDDEELAILIYLAGL